ncbi:hypothetical protein [Streptantibioticus cattleyicolor]|uniref:Uncharacterized protein n=1 Tax=Streptantibioticus cattleyicolor (strain ATCC 35852 / DSM 46488 / JCM 4925 / NBRC 14057 / NRRL 8057) TaxID=1003195 RepID=G8XEC2_STREN|nr:hypothetical protein SCATT_p10830 [Streptantibioticus cattleyicolor NRRL 8057 = DSM 46488]
MFVVPVSCESFPSRFRLRRGVVALLVCVVLLGAGACSGKGGHGGGSTAANPSPSSSQNRVRLAKTRFVANASLAAGAAYQWIYKPYRAGTFHKGAKGRTSALVKGGLAGLFSYHRFRAAIRDAQGDPTLSKAVAPLTGGVDRLKEFSAKIRNGSATDADFKQVQNTVNGVKSAGHDNGADVTDKVPSQKQLTSGG